MKAKTNYTNILLALAAYVGLVAGLVLFQTFNRSGDSLNPYPAVMAGILGFITAIIGIVKVTGILKVLPIIGLILITLLLGYLIFIAGLFFGLNAIFGH